MRHRQLKLQQPARERASVRDLSKRTGVPADELMAVLSELGEHVAAPSSHVEPPVINRLFDYLGIQEADEASQDTRTAEASSPDSSPSVPHRPPRLAPIGPAWSSDEVEDVRSHSAQHDTSPAFAYSEWSVRRFSDAERDVWMDAGLRSGQAKMAADARDAGLLPSDLHTKVNGWKVVDRLRDGEGAKGVARLLRATQETAS